MSDPVTTALVDRYLRAVESADLPGMLSLFADDAVIVSPLYGELPATEFYPRLFADTAQADLTLLGTMRGTTVAGTPLVSFLFHFDWTLPGGVAAPFEVVDVAELDEAGRITRLRIVYDTVAVRPAFERAVRASGDARS